MRVRGRLRGRLLLLIGASLRFAARQLPVLEGLSANAYSLYLVHYDFVVWLQFALLGTTLFAIVKGAIVFGGTLLLSWAATLAFQHLPFGARLIGAAPRAAAVSWSAQPALMQPRPLTWLSGGVARARFRSPPIMCIRRGRTAGD